MRDRGTPALRDGEEVKELVRGLIIMGIMVVTWKAGAPWGWVVFEAVLALLCMV